MITTARKGDTMAGYISSTANNEWLAEYGDKRFVAETMAEAAEWLNEQIYGKEKFEQNKI